MLNRIFIVAMVMIAIAVSAFGQATVTLTPVTPDSAIAPPPSQSGPELGNITKRANPSDYPRVIAFYRNDNDTCEVKVFVGDIVNVVTSEYWADVTHRETLQIYIGRDGLPVMRRILESEMTTSGADPLSLFDLKTPRMFLYRCQLATNRDIPPEVKKKFYGYLGIK